MFCLNCQVSGASGLRGAHVQRPVVQVEGVTEHARVKEVLRAWDPRERLKSAKYRTVQVRTKKRFNVISNENLRVPVYEPIATVNVNEQIYDLNSLRLSS